MGIPLDLKSNPCVCDCEFDPPYDVEKGDYHYRRWCSNCKQQWFSLHCPHESPRRCAHCNYLMPALIVVDRDDRMDIIKLVVERAENPDSSTADIKLMRAYSDVVVNQVLRTSLTDLIAEDR